MELKIENGVLKRIIANEGETELIIPDTVKVNRFGRNGKRRNLRKSMVDQNYNHE